jgi:hypothetical protein
MAQQPRDSTSSSDGYAIRVRAYAAAHFDFDEHLVVRWPDASAWFVSEYTGGDDGRAYPVTIHGEIRGVGQLLGDAEQRLGAAVRNVFPVLSLAANAAMADPLAVASYGLDLSTPQPFTGYETPQAHDWVPPGARRFDLEATLALLTAVGQHPHTDLLPRAIESYRRAVGHWVPEERILAGEFLFIAAETLSRFLIECRAHAAGMTPNLAGIAHVELRPHTHPPEPPRDPRRRGPAVDLRAGCPAGNGLQIARLEPR